MLNFLPADFTSTEDPNTKVSGIIASCGKCDEHGLPSHWIVFQLDSQKHFHIQCSTCDTSYYPQGGDCERRTN